MSKGSVFEIVDLLENEDGSVTMTIDADADHFALVYQIGMKLILYCAAKNIPSQTQQRVLQAVLLIRQCRSMFLTWLW